MECNKEVAIHAKEIAEKRLLKRDYAGAKVMALKAKKLFPLDNISQLLAVCEVHCSAQLMANGLYDWYKIIQVEPLSDEIMIRKQYHKLAALLHPDKNKIPGAEPAFKLVGEANNTLSDRAKRIMYDLKRKHLVRSMGPQQSTETNAAHNYSSNLNGPQQQPQTQRYQGFTFWTECPGCGTLHQYNRNILCHIVCCTCCSRNFIANALPHLNPGHMDGGRSPQQWTVTNAAHNSSSNLNRANKWRAQQQPQLRPHQGFTFRTECPSCGTLHLYYRNILYYIVRCTHCSRSFIANALPHLKPGHMYGGRNQPQQFTSLRQPQKSDFYRFTCDRGVGGTTRDITGGVRKPDSNPNPLSMSNLSGPNTITGQMRGKTFTADTRQNPNPCSKPNLSFDFNQRRGDREGTDGGVHAAGTSTPLRWSPCNKPDVKYNVEPGCSSPTKRARVEVNGVRDGNSSANAVNTNTSSSTRVEGEMKEQDREREKHKEQVEPSGLLGKNNIAFKPSGSVEDKGATSKNARVEVEGVRDVNGSANGANTNTGASTYVEGELKEQDREKEKEKEQVEQSGLLETSNTAFKPCGSAEDKGATSKKARVEEKGVRNGNGSANAANTSASTLVEGEVKEHDREKEKEQVEPSGLLVKNNTAFKPSGSAEDKSTTSKKARVDVKGLRNGNGSASAANTKTSTLVEGVKEQDRVKDKEQVEPSGLLEKNNTAFKPSGSAEDKGTTSQVANVGTLMVRCESSQPTSDVEYLYEYPDAEFHNFDMFRTCDKFQKGHIWALYSDLDSFPKYYGSICKVEHNPLKVHISWLEACPKFEVERAWLDANFPISCGKFRVTTQNTIYDKPEYFSHMVSVRHHGSGNYYEILPEVGEIWAIYKNWSARWTRRDFQTCKFDIVEIREQREDSTIVWPLRQVPDITSVFMPEQDDGTGSGTWEVSASAFILFSHKIPAIRLTNECGGKLKGFWELDPASVPYAFS